MCFGTGAWRNGLYPEPLQGEKAFYRYGTQGRGSNDTFSVPIVSVLDHSADAGISLALSPEDPLLEVYINTSSSGVVFQRELLRLGQGREVTFTAHLVGHAGCWRPGLQFLVDEYKPFFAPWAEDAASFEGLGSYSWNQDPYNATRARSIGFKTNWDLSGTWMPYDGLFLPYQDEWLNLGPINGGLAQYNVTYRMIDEYLAQIQRQGFHSLSYFDIGNWGTRITTNYHGPNTTCGVRPNGKPAPCPDPNGSNEYLRDHLSDALLHHGWDVYHGKWMVHKTDWVGCTDMDTQVSSFEDLLVEQLALHVERLPHFEGIAIDRLDYSEFFNYDYDDNTSWVPRNGTQTTPVKGDLSVWGPARALRLSYRHTFDRLHEKLHPSAVAAAKGGGTPKGSRGEPKDRMMLNNCNMICRLDEMRSFDGTFSEGAALNSVAWTGLRNPTILWTYALSDDVASLDAYFQQHLLMNVFPMAPMPKNDHSIQPGSPIVEQAYLDYAPLFGAMHGARWLLTAHPASTRSASSGGEVATTVNVLTSGAGGYLVQVMLGGKETSVAVVLNLPDATSSQDKLELVAWHPGAGSKPVAIGPAQNTPAGWEVTVPLVRGCATVGITVLQGGKF